MKRKWTQRRFAAVAVSVTGDEKIWKIYSLCLICNRSVPECFDDNDVSTALRNMAERLPLPYGFDFESWTPK